MTLPKALIDSLIDVTKKKRKTTVQQLKSIFSVLFLTHTSPKFVDYNLFWVSFLLFWSKKIKKIGKLLI